MPTELEELVGFVAHPNPQIRQVATENLVPYSTAQPSIFRAEHDLPIKHLKLLVNDQPKIVEHVLNILINLSADREILENLATDNKFLDTILSHITSSSEPNANLIAMLLANLEKSDAFIRILDQKQQPPEALKSDDKILNQLVDLFVKGVDGQYNKTADYDYLAYLFADLAKHANVRQYMVTKQDYDGVVPLTKLKVFTEHKSDIRRRGVASTIKNVAFDVHAHAVFLSDDEINILPYILLPIAGNEQYDEEEMLNMLPDLQLLPPDKQRDPDHTVVQTHVETLTLLTSTRDGRDLMRQVNVYPIIRETHLHVDDPGVREACERLVQVLMRDEHGDENGGPEEAEDNDNRIVEVL